MLRIVLVEPREAGNVGAAARVMKNFGFASLTIAGPHPELLPVAGWWASGADDVLASAAYAPALGEAIGDAHVTIATTSMRGRADLPALTPQEVARLYASLAPEQTLALVFGREDRGLEQEEVMLCQRTAAVPTHPAFAVMNLAQAVGIFCFALSQIAPVPRVRALAPGSMVERMHQRIRGVLVKIGFLNQSNPDVLYDELRILLGRADLDEREITLLLGIVRQAEWALEKGQPGKS
jgi:TrmH family RNA methyltransferase